MPRRLILCLAAFIGAALSAGAQAPSDKPLRQLATGDEARAWEAVGRLDFGVWGFCTGTLIAPDLVLTAAHCLYDKETGARVDPGTIEFRAGWRNGRAEAYRRIRRAVPHPDYVYGASDPLRRVENDLALLQLDMPIRLPSVEPFETGGRPAQGDEVGVVSYAQDRSEVPSLQEVCHVMARQTEVLVLSCEVDFGASGAPIFAFRDGVARVVSVVSAKADYDGRTVALATAIETPLARLMAEMARPQTSFVATDPTRRSGGGAKFVRPAPAD